MFLKKKKESAKRPKQMFYLKLHNTFQESIPSHINSFFLYRCGEPIYYTQEHRFEKSKETTGSSATDVTSITVWFELPERKK